MSTILSSTTANKHYFCSSYTVYRQRFNLLRRQAKAAEGTEGAETSPPKAKGSGTPSKRKKTGAADGNGENADGTPTKRKRRTKAEMEAARAMKNEQMGGPVKGEGGQDYYQGGSQEMQQSIEFDEAAEFNVGQ